MKLFNIVWGAPENLWLFPLVILALFFVVYRYRRLQAALHLLVGDAPQRFNLGNVSPKIIFLKAVFWFVGFFCIYLALLRPQWNKKEETIKQQGRDLFIALDVSRSMLARDCEPNRIEYAKNKIKKLVHKLSSERVGLILYSGSAFVQCPLTADESAFNMFLDQVDVETISSGTTAIDQAINKALDVYDRMPQRKNKLLVLFTDGEDFSSNLSRIKNRANKSGMHIFTLGVGTPEGAPIPLFDARGNQSGHQLDKRGGIVISRLNEDILQNLAIDTGGTYLQLSKNNNDINQLIRKVVSFEKEELESKRFAKLEEQSPYFLCVSFVCFALEWIL